MKKIQKFSSLKAGTAPVVLGLAMLASPAFAQSAAEEAPAGEIVVTGTRIARPNVEAASPVTVVTSEAIKEFGATKVEDLTNSLPQVFAGQSSGVSNGADGTATIDLRGLGPSRTVVLIDGRRLMPGNIGGGAGADLNFIPAALVSGVELLTGGASATYGADAVAGVVNFKMNRDFRGVRLDAQYGFYQHTNNNDIRSIVNGSGRVTAPEGNVTTGQAYDATLALGAGFDDDRGNIVAYAGYRHESAITQDKYDYSICTLNPNGTNDGFACGGSGTPARARFGGFSAANRTLAGLPAASSYTLLDTNSLRPYSGLTDAFNFGPANYYRRPSDRYTAGAFAEYAINDSFKPYMDVMFMDYSTKAQIAPSGAFFGPRTVNCDNPLLLANPTLATATCGAAVGTSTNASILIGKRNVEGGNRFNDIGFNQFRIVTGMKGDITDSWQYDAYAQIGQIKVANTYRNDVSSARINKALQVVNVGGVATCKSVVDGSDPSCVPYNVFNAGGISSAAASYIGIPLVLTGTTKEKVFAGQITGDLGSIGFQSPLSDEAVKIALGTEYRTESLETQPDLAYINGDGAGQGGPTLPISGKYSVTDIFGETSIPIVTDKPFFQDLSLELGFRRSTYDVQGAAGKNSENTWKIAGTWKPIEDITFRASRNRAVRSPNIGELFSNQSVGLFSGTDPCAGTTPTATAAQCALTGVTAGQYGNIIPNTAQQYNQFTGGNLNLNPEKADSWTAGVVLTPKGFLSGFTASVDYYNIKVKDAVGTIGAQVILNQCISTGDPFFCGKINRSPASAGAAAGSLWLDESGFVNNQTTNTGSFSSAGVDINADYRTTIGNNKLKWEFVGTYLDKYTSQPITGGFSYDCAGFYGITCGNPNPKYRFNTNLKLTTANDFGFTVRWRYLGGVTVDTLSADPDLASPGAAPTVDEKIKAQSYFDLLFALPIKDSMTLRIGVNNIFDRDPPIISQASLGGFGNGNVFPGTYDYLGRNIFINLSADF
ncbi:TonB-dependent receptor [Chakrabartia godavariana]|nr:TonB-dependent receptor [Chakrabartia godavariana]